jgi:hypothetical protein
MQSTAARKRRAVAVDDAAAPAAAATPFEGCTVLLSKYLLELRPKVRMFRGTFCGGPPSLNGWRLNLKPLLRVCVFACLRVCVFACLRVCVACVACVRLQVLDGGGKVVASVAASITVFVCSDDEFARQVRLRAAAPSRLSAWSCR